MSDLTAAAAAMGLPEVLVQRSAEARAAETGATVDDLLAAWAGGAAPPPTADTPASAPAEPETVAAPVEEPPAPEVTTEVPTEQPPVAAAPAGPYKPPVLVGASDNPMSILIGAVALFMLVFLVGLVGPSLQAETPGALSSDLSYTPTGSGGSRLLHKPRLCCLSHADGASGRCRRRAGGRHPQRQQPGSWHSALWARPVQRWFPGDVRPTSGHDRGTVQRASVVQPHASRHECIGGIFE